MEKTVTHNSFNSAYSSLSLDTLEIALSTQLIKGALNKNSNIIKSIILAINFLKENFIEGEEIHSMDEIDRIEKEIYVKMNEVIEREIGITLIDCEDINLGILREYMTHIYNFFVLDYTETIYRFLIKHIENNNILENYNTKISKQDLINSSNKNSTTHSKLSVLQDLDDIVKNIISAVDAGDMITEAVSYDPSEVTNACIENLFFSDEMEIPLAITSLDFNELFFDQFRSDLKVQSYIINKVRLAITSKK